MEKTGIKHSGWREEKRLKSLLDLTCQKERKKKERGKGQEPQKSIDALGTSPDYIAGHYRPHLTPESHHAQV
ncbi:Uncharacterized protein APZ42_014817 [Daphnia magna]|uniref:Uncharacterized protein n=1 Tax=Daphnia magna TaxID=35525 RepID=A0A162PJY2_9CRUS|nr:Uncharacterized protein APZ42_014817 [Daphnia magna]